MLYGMFNPSLSCHTTHFHMSDYSVLSRRHAGSFFPEYLFPWRVLGKKGEMPTSEETRFKQGYREQVLLPLSISSQNRTLFVSTPTAVINTAIPSDGFHTAQSTSNGLTLHRRLCGHRPLTLTKEFQVPEHTTNLHPTAVHTILVKIYFYNTGICTVSSQVLLAEKCMKKTENEQH